MAQQEKPTVFISFNSKSKEFVNSLEAKLSKSARVLRYEDEVPDWGSFIAFMDTIKEQDFAVLVISDAYLKSFACMYEVIQAMKRPNWKDKTMFAIMEGAKPYSDEQRIKYISYWVDECERMQKQVDSLPQKSSKALRKKLKKMTVIRDSMDEFLNTVADSKCPQIWNVIEAICDRVNISKGSRFFVVTNDSELPIPLKEWLVVEAIEANGPMTTWELSEVLGMSVPVVIRRVRELCEAGILEKQEQYKVVITTPTDARVVRQTRKVSVYSISRKKE